ncbi:MAG: uncharacterized protein QOI44_1951 [Actinomycetota bacterium]|nr:uncharacterized protein [Actinomycetota bacterium]
MRVPPVPIRRRRSFGIRGWLIGIAVLLVVLLLSARGLARVFTDYLWFKEVGFSHTWRALIEAKLFPALIFAVVFFVLLLVNLIVADRLAPLARSTGPEDEIIERYRSVVDPYAGRIRFAVAFFFAIVMGSGVASQWRDWILFSNATKFGVKDPQFHRDIGFYVFKLPFLQFMASWTFAALLVMLIITAVFHYLNGGIRLQTPFQRVTPQVKVHISVILALMALTKTVQYDLSRFALTLSHRGTVDGATYTDVKAQLPALNLLMLISVAAAILFIANIFRKGWVFPIIAVGLWGFISIVVGTVYPAIIQRFVVQPNEFAREQTYIKRNIDATQAAFGLDRIQLKSFAYNTDLTEGDVADNKATLDNVRLWDPQEVKEVMSATQEFQPYFTFSDADIDRYSVHGQKVSTLTGVRELDPTHIPSSTWTNRHLVYTHGVGVDSARANSHNQDSPDYLLSDLPPTGDLDLTQPDVYFGEGFSGYSVVDTKVAEQEVNGRTTTSKTKYEGSGGVKVSGLARRLAFALRFGDFNLVYSGQLTSQSRVLYLRDIRQRVETAAPFLSWDHDPYPIVQNGRILWMLDGYTTTNRYPYSQSISPIVPTGSGLGSDINYIRNSVKATVDSYDGSIHFYIVDTKDPIIKTWSKAFPDLFDSVKDMPAGLQDHWRYPEDLFDTQTEQYTQYHMTDPQQFFQKATLWDIAPNSDSAGATNTATTSPQGGDNGGRNTTLASSGNGIEPLYQMMALPGISTKQEFVLQRPFVPRSKPNQLSSFLVARNDANNYGDLVLYQMPTDSVAPSPFRASSLIEANNVISKQFSLLDQRGSSVVRGAPQLVPINNSIFYVRPIFVRGKDSFPRWNYVAVTYGENAVLDQVGVADAAKHLLNNTQPPVPLDGGSGTPTTTPTTPSTTPNTQPPGGQTVESMLAQAAALTPQANQALADQDLGKWQDIIKEQQRLIQRANELAGQSSSGTTTTVPSSTSTSSPKTTTTAHA